MSIKVMPDIKKIKYAYMIKLFRDVLMNTQIAEYLCIWMMLCVYWY